MCLPQDELAAVVRHLPGPDQLVVQHGADEGPIL